MEVEEMKTKESILFERRKKTTVENSFKTSGYVSCTCVDVILFQ